ncbi:MAG: ABC transporter permease subunit [Deltaproteobacteria bacterium]|nr:ABC transporter permease subunit [Deltaproteobacteria bacterium]
MFQIILKRILIAIPVLLCVAAITFFLIRLAPGGPFDSEKVVPPEILKNLNERYNLNAPVHIQFFDYMKNVVQGDFGPSFRHPNRSVSEMIFIGLPVTFELGCYALLVALGVGITAGVTASLRPNTIFDYLPMSISMVGICMPNFLLGPLLILIFGIWFEWLPVSGWGEIPGDKILPAITLGSAYTAYVARLSRGGMLEILSQDFIRTARAKGVPEYRIVIQHALKGGLLPVVSFLGPAAAWLLTGSFVIETIFQIPGLGRFFIQAAFNRDYTMIMGTTIFLSTLIILFNLLSDILTIFLNPKLKYDISQD